MDLHSNLKKRLELEDWEYIAHMARTFELDMEEKDSELVKLQKELQIIKHMVHAYLSHDQSRDKFLSTKFLIKMHRTLLKLDEKVSQNSELHGQFLSFLRALMHKMKQEKLIVYKTLEKTKEFQRHKEFGNSL